MRPSNFEEDLVPDKEMAIVNVVSEKEVFVRSIRVYPGQKLWKYNLAKKEFEVVELKNAQLVPNPNLKDETDIHYTVSLEKGCIYVPALNIKNAMRKARAEVNKLISEYKTKNT